MVPFGDGDERDCLQLFQAQHCHHFERGDQPAQPAALEPPADGDLRHADQAGMEQLSE